MTSATPADGPERRVRLVGDRVALLADVGRLGEAGVDLAGVHGHPLGVRNLAEGIPEVAVARHRGGLGPGDLQLRRSLDRVLLRRRDDAEEVALADDPGALDVLDRARVHLQRPNGSGVRPLPERTDDPAVEHPRQAEVVDVRVGAGDLLRGVLARLRLADHLVLRVMLLRRPARVRGGEPLPAEQCAVGDGLGRVALDRDDALVDRQLGDGHAELLRGEPEQHSPSLRGGLADGRGAGGDAVRADRPALVGREVGVDAGSLQLVVGHVQLLGRDLQQAGRRARDVDLAHVHRDRVVLVHDDPGVDRVRVWRSGHDALRRAGGPIREQRAGEAEADHERAAALDELLAVERPFEQLVDLALSEQLGHYAPFAIVAEARLIAFVIRG